MQLLSSLFYLLLLFVYFTAGCKANQPNVDRRKRIWILEMNTSDLCSFLKPEVATSGKDAAGSVRWAPQQVVHPQEGNPHGSFRPSPAGSPWSKGPAIKRLAAEKSPGKRWLDEERQVFSLRLSKWIHRFILSLAFPSRPRGPYSSWGHSGSQTHSSRDP